MGGGCLLCCWGLPGPGGVVLCSGPGGSLATGGRLVPASGALSLEGGACPGLRRDPGLWRTGSRGAGGPWPLGRALPSPAAISKPPDPQTLIPPRRYFVDLTSMKEHFRSKVHKKR